MGEQILRVPKIKPPNPVRPNRGRGDVADTLLFYYTELIVYLLLQFTPPSYVYVLDIEVWMGEMGEFCVITS